MKDPPPGLRFLAFADNGLYFELCASITTLVHRKGKMISALNFGIHEKFHQHHITFPYPRRDLHIRGGSLEVRLPDREE